MKKLLLAVLVLAALARPAAAEGWPAALAGSPVYSDQAFQDFVETAYGYKGPAGDALRAPAYRDAVAAPAAPAPPPAPMFMSAYCPAWRAAPPWRPNWSAARVSSSPAAATWCRAGSGGCGCRAG